jgi:hypothetical protein
VLTACALPADEPERNVEAVVEALIPITMFLSIAAVMILRPITRRIGMLLEAMARDREQARHVSVTDTRMLNLMEQMSKRLELMEERLDFTERLVASPRQDRLRTMNRQP